VAAIHREIVMREGVGGVTLWVGGVTLWGGGHALREIPREREMQVVVRERRRSLSPDPGFFVVLYLVPLI
jgi:hypothetical protein